MLCRHPTPAEGRDDDINLLSEVLQDILTTLGRYPEIPIRKESFLLRSQDRKEPNSSNENQGKVQTISPRVHSTSSQKIETQRFIHSL